MKYYGDIELMGSTILNALIENLGSDPVFTVEESGRIYFNTTSDTLRLNNGTTYVDASLPATFSNLIDSLGAVWINTDLTFNPSAFNQLINVGSLTANDSLFTVLQQLDSAIKDSNIGILDLSDVAVTTNLEQGDILFYNGTNFTFADIDSLVQNYAHLSLSNLTDVTLGDVGSGDFLVYDSVTSKFVAANPIQPYEDLQVSTNHTILHTLGVKYCNVTVINRSTDTIITDAIVSFLDINQIQITLNTPAPVLVIVTGSPNLS
jgi:hypothetical protein